MKVALTVRTRRWLIPWLFIVPILTIHLVVIIGPSAGAIYYSLTKWDGIGKATFVGIQNYISLFSDSDLGRAFVDNLAWLGFFLTIPIVLALLVSSLLAPLGRLGLVFRTVLFVPYILPSVITSSIWADLLEPDVGIGSWFVKLGLPGLNQAWLGQPHTALVTAAFVDGWHWWGFLMVLFLTAMQNVPRELYDAAEIDGANRRQEFFHITVPGIQPTLVFMLVMTGIWSFLAFDYVWILTQGGPAESSVLLSVLVFQNAFMKLQAGYAAAIGLTMSFLSGIVVLIYIFLQNRGWEI